MSTKQLRLSESSQIRSRAVDFLGKEVNVVMINGNVFLGKLNTVTETGLSVTNMRLKKISLAFQEIGEVYFDSQT